MTGRPEIVSKIVRVFLSETATDVGEIALDQMLESGVFKDAPVVGILARALAAGKGVHDALLLAKFLQFAEYLEETTAEQRADFLAKLDDKREWERLQRDLFLLLDRIDQEEKAPLLARAFTAMVRGEIDRWDFARFAGAILGGEGA